MDKLTETVLSILAGSKVTLEIFIFTLAMSLPLGFFVALLRLSGIRPLSILMDVYIWIMRGSPLMLQLLFVYFALPMIGVRFSDIAAALLHSPEIVFFDEPTIGVDVMGKDSIRSFIRDLNAEDKVTMIFTTHDMQDIEKTCKRLIIINKGSKIYDGTLDGIRKLHGSSRQLDVFFMND